MRNRTRDETGGDSEKDGDATSSQARGFHRRSWYQTANSEMRIQIGELNAEAQFWLSIDSHPQAKRQLEMLISVTASAET